MGRRSELMRSAIIGAALAGPLLFAITTDAAATCHTEHNALMVDYQQTIANADAAADSAAQAARAGEEDRCRQFKAEAERHGTDIIALEDELRILGLTRGCFGHTADTTTVDGWNPEAKGFRYDAAIGGYALSGVDCSATD